MVSRADLGCELPGYSLALEDRAFAVRPKFGPPVFEELHLSTDSLVDAEKKVCLLASGGHMAGVAVAIGEPARVASEKKHRRLLHDIESLRCRTEETKMSLRNGNQHISTRWWRASCQVVVRWSSNADCPALNVLLVLDVPLLGPYALPNVNGNMVNVIAAEIRRSHVDVGRYLPFASAITNRGRSSFIPVNLSQTAENISPDIIMDSQPPGHRIRKPRASSSTLPSLRPLASTLFSQTANSPPLRCL